ncbi:MAG: TolC family protein [Pirellulaceae bacterium]|nr:TolC family protein [Pirellulaceae bacterium]
MFSAISLCAMGCAARTASKIIWGETIGLVSPNTNNCPPVDEQQAVELSQEQFTEPLSLLTPEKQPWLISPTEAIQIAVERSKILQDLGGTTLRSVNNISTIHDPSIQSTDPRLGIEAALAAFDAQYNSRLFYNKNDFPVNNRLLGGGTNLLQQDLVTFQNELTKATAYGTELFARNNTSYDANNAPSNLFGSSWQTNLEAGFRHHLGRGGGLDYNRIAGPGATPGNYSGILIARVNADSSILDFEMGLRDLVSDVENAYWDLYFAYRNLEAKIAARDAALNTWRVEKEYRDSQSGSGEKEARAREQYYRFESQVLEALTGREVDGTRTSNGSSGGTFRATEGVHVAERRLRLVMNLPINDDRMLRPVHDPILVKVIFDWNQVVGESLQLRPELRKQDLQLKRGQLELLASRNALLPQIDLLTQYRIRGFGQELWGANTAQFDNAVASMTSGDFQEWQFGVEMNMPVGLRRAYNNVQNAKLKLARDQDLLDQKQRRVIHDLSNAYASVVRSFEIANVSMNQRSAAHEQLASLRNLEENKSRVNTNEMLDAQNRVTQADAGYYDAIVRYMIALKNIHFEKGTLLEYNNIAFLDRVRPKRTISLPNGMTEGSLTDYSVPLRAAVPNSPRNGSANAPMEAPANAPVTVPADVPIPLPIEQSGQPLPVGDGFPQDTPIVQPPVIPALGPPALDRPL